MLKKEYIVIFFIMLLPLCNTLGFDIYSHVVAYYNFEELPFSYKNYHISDVYFARYLLLSLILEIGGQIGVPVGFLIMVLIYIPVKSIFRPGSNFYYLSNNKSYVNNVIYIALVFIICIIVLFYSALSLSVLWGISYYFSKKKYLLIGSIFHPAGVVIYVLINGWTVLLALCRVFVIFLLFHIFYSMSGLSLLHSLRPSQITFNLIEFDFSIVYSKSREIILSLCFVLLFGRKIKRSLNRNTMQLQKSCYNFMTIFISSYCFFIAAFIMTLNKDTPLIYTMSGESNPVFDVAWSIADREYNFYELTNFRYGR